MPTALKRRLETLAARTEKEINELWRRSRLGVFDQDTFVEMAAIVIARARTQGVVLADLALAAAVAAALDDVPAPIGLAIPSEDVDRLHHSVHSVLSDKVKGATTSEEMDRSRGLRLGRLARDAPVDALTWAMGLAMTEHATQSGLDIGWTRGTDLDPCVVCRNLADGVVRPPSVQMKRHRGCMCVPETVIGGSG